MVFLRILIEPPPMRPELRNRILFGVILALLLAAGVWSDLTRHSHLAMASVALVAVALGSAEYTRLARALAAEVQFWPTLVVSLLIVAEAILHQPAPAGSCLATWQVRTTDLPLVTLFLALGMAWASMQQMFRHGTERFFANVGGTVLGMVYLGVSLNCALRLTLIEAPGDPSRGVFLTLLFIAAVKGGDIAAYFGGRALGRHKLAPRVSPGKTWEGFACSFLGAAAAVFLLRCILMSPWSGLADPFDAWWKPVLWAVVLAPLGVVGDLVESCMKRDASVKDSGTVLPGFGGVLDVLDAILIAAPAAYVLALIL